MYERLKVLITVKTYPSPSAHHTELVCTAGIREDTGQMVRLFPVPFRDLPKEKQYKKYQWVEMMAEKNTSDPRPESYRPDVDSIQLGQEVEGWGQREKIILQCPIDSIESLNERQQNQNTSLGLVKPRIVKDLAIKEDREDWSKEQL